MKANLKMEKILNSRRYKILKKSDTIIIDELITNPRFVFIHGCVIIDNENELEESKVNLERVLNMFVDKTGYEASVNEIRINDFINDFIDEYELILIGIELLELWKKKLKVMYEDKEFQFILAANKGYVTIRMHTIRKEEKGWLDNNLDNYENAILMFS